MSQCRWELLSKGWKVRRAAAPALRSPGPYLSSPAERCVDALSLAEMETVVSTGPSASFPSCVQLPVLIAWNEAWPGDVQMETG